MIAAVVNVTVRGGVVQGIEAPEQVRVGVLDWDNVNAGDVGLQCESCGCRWSQSQGEKRGCPCGGRVVEVDE